MFGKTKVAALVAEFFGTAVLAMAVLAIISSVNIPFFAALAAGMTLGLMVLVIGGTSGAHINPAVTLGLWSLRKVQTAQAIVYVAAQVLGGLVAWRLGEYLLDSPLTHTANWGVDKRVLIAELVGTFIFTFGVASAVYNAYEGRTMATAVGGSLALGVLVASMGSNGLLNPGVAVGLNSMSWAYAAGPLLGSVLGMNTYALLFAPAKKSSKKRK